MNSRNEKMAQAYRDGATITRIAAVYGLSLSWTGRILRQQGVAMPPVRQGVKRELNIARVVSDYEGGATIQQVADTHHASYGTIRRLLLREKVAIRPHGGQNAISLRAGQADDGPPRPKKTKTVRSRTASTHSPRRRLAQPLLRQ
ncbi:helix-turn-helix domain-containing protein [Amycolatopsis echigonensis]|nr:hypothetical protein [Amycolatopsis niigatensis]